MHALVTTAKLIPPRQHSDSRSSGMCRFSLLLLKFSFLHSDFLSNQCLLAITVGRTDRSLVSTSLHKCLIRKRELQSLSDVTRLALLEKSSRPWFLYSQPFNCFEFSTAALSKKSSGTSSAWHVMSGWCTPDTSHAQLYIVATNSRGEFRYEAH
jgi:hypothetical protein